MDDEEIPKKTMAESGETAGELSGLCDKECTSTAYRMQLEGNCTELAKHLLKRPRHFMSCIVTFISVRNFFLESR